MQFQENAIEILQNLFYQGFYMNQISISNKQQEKYTLSRFIMQNSRLNALNLNHQLLIFNYNQIIINTQIIQFSIGMELEINEQKHQQEEVEINLKSSVICSLPKQKKIKKVSLLKKKNNMVPIYNSPIIKQLFMIGDICVINQDSVRDPQDSKQSFIVNSIQFSKITSINLNTQFFTINVKRNQQNFMTSKYLIDRFSSFGNKQLKYFADNISDMIYESALVQQNILKTQQQMGKQIFWEKLNQIKQRRYQQCEQLLFTKFKDKKYIVLYYSDGLKGLGLDKIMISNQMLRQTGLKSSQLINQYAKQKSLHFQLMGTGAYKEVFLSGARQTADGMKSNRLKNKSILEIDQTQNQFSDFYTNLDTQIYRKRHNGQVEWEQKVKCPMKFLKPKPYIAVFLFGQAQQKPIAIMNQKTKKIEMLQFQPKPTYEEQMKKILVNNFQYLTLQSDKKQSEMNLQQNMK